MHVLNIKHILTCKRRQCCGSRLQRCCMGSFLKIEPHSIPWFIIILPIQMVMNWGLPVFDTKPKGCVQKKKHLRLGKQPYIFPRVFPWAFLGYPGTLINNSKTSSPSLDFTYAPTPLTLALAWPLSGPVGIGETRHGWVSNLRAGRHHLISALLEISWTSWMHTCHLSLAMFCWRRLRRQPKSTKPLSGFDWLV